MLHSKQCLIKAWEAIEHNQSTAKDDTDENEKKSRKQKKTKINRAGKEKMSVPRLERQEHYFVVCMGITHCIQWVIVAQSNSKMEKTRPRVA